SGLAKPLDDCLEVLVSEILDASNPRKFFCRLLRPRRCTELEASAPFASAPQPCGRSRNSFPFHLGNGQLVVGAGRLCAFAGDRAAPRARRGRRPRAANPGLSIRRGEQSRAAGGRAGSWWAPLPMPGERRTRGALGFTRSA